MPVDSTSYACSESAQSACRHGAKQAPLLFKAFLNAGHQVLIEGEPPERFRMGLYGLGLIV
jgi:hypothetical protein